MYDSYSHDEAMRDGETIGDHLLVDNPHDVSQEDAYEANARRSAYIKRLENCCPCASMGDLQERLEEAFAFARTTVPTLDPVRDRYKAEAERWERVAQVLAVLWDEVSPCGELQGDCPASGPDCSTRCEAAILTWAEKEAEK